MDSPQTTRSAFAQEVADQRKNSPGWSRYEWVPLLLITFLIFSYFLNAHFDIDSQYQNGDYYHIPATKFLMPLQCFCLFLTIRTLIAGANTFNRNAEWH